MINKYSKKEDLPLVLDVKDVKAIMDLGINQVYELFNSNEFRVVKVGRRKKVSRDVFFNWLEKNKEERNEEVG